MSEDTAACPVPSGQRRVVPDSIWVLVNRDGECASTASASHAEAEAYRSALANVWVGGSWGDCIIVRYDRSTPDDSDGAP